MSQRSGPHLELKIKKEDNRRWDVRELKKAKEIMTNESKKNNIEEDSRDLNEKKKRKQR
jgi:hypothetical protein